MQEFHYMVNIENRLRALVTLQNQGESPVGDHKWLMALDLFYDGDAAGKTSFTLHGYSEEEAQKIAQSIGENDYMMKEIDEFLWGEND
jgi:hypothetical protein